ncbi:ADP-ribosyltransferase domain-containing protein, partial [Streptomyces sp. NPDC018964]|uniref:ADP-ribosyltransferase domain-containing protein n=1 Tax=Streptomyces sp. NPDC018964 TaxID=3365058 RepID=UPI0037A78DE6
MLRLRGGGPGGSQSERDIIDHWIAESDRLGRSRSGKLQDIDRAVEAWVTGGRDHPLAFEQNKWELQAIDLAIGAWLAEPHGSTRTAAVERLQQRVRQELTASDMLSRSFPYLAVPGYRTSHEERQSFRNGFADYQLHRRQMPSGSYFRRIPEEDLVALIAYTGITEFSAVNQALRTGDRRVLAGYAPLIKSSISGLNQLAPHTGTVYRGISLNPAQTQAALARYAPGRVVQEPAFVSTNAFAPRFSGNIQFEIESRSGRSVQAISRHKNVENEVLFPPGTSFQVQSVQDRGGIWTIRMTEVAPAQDSPPAAEPSSLARQGEPLPWVDASGWRKIGEKLGSNVGGTYEDARGHRFYLKLARTPDHARNEVLAAALYRLAGVQVPELRLITREGKYGTASRFLENAHQDLERKLKDKSYRKAIYDGFAVDAWLANWDVAGRYYDNIVNVGGNPVRIDTGGALMYSGKGDLKGNRFASHVTEWDNLRDYATNPQTFDVFKDITAKAMQESARRVIAITPQQIDAAIDSVGFSDRTTAYLKTTLKARRIDVARLAGLPLPAETAGPAGRTPIAAPAPSSAFTSAPSQYRGPQAPLTASQMLAMVNRRPAEPSTDLPALTQQFSHVGLSRTNTGIESPQASGSRLPAYPLVDRALLDQWRGRFSEERAALRSLPDGQNWLTTAAHLVARDHVAPPPLGSTMSASEQAYQELYSGIVFVVAARLHRDRAQQHPQERAHALSLDLGSTFGSLRSQAAPTGSTRTQQWSEPAPGIDSGELIGDGRGFGAATGFAGVEDSSRAMEVARELIDVPAEVERPLAARAEAARLIGLLLHDDVVAERVAGSDVRVVIVPRSRHLADLPPYAGTQGEDRPPVSARGWTDQQRAVVAVSEENLLGQEAADADRTHPEGYSSVLHEAAHLVYAFGLEDARRARVEEAFSTRRGAATPRQWVDGPLRDLHGNPSANHSSSDAAEYFAQSTVAYFGANHGRDSITHQQRNNGAAWLAEHDPVLNSLLHELYGPPPAEPLHANALSVTAADQSMWEAFNWHTTNTEGSQDSARQVPGTAAHARQHSSEEPVGSGVTETVPSVEGTGAVGSRDTLRAPEPETAQTPQRPARTEQGRLTREDSTGLSGPHQQTAPATPLVAFLDAPNTDKSRSTPQPVPASQAPRQSLPHERSEQVQKFPADNRSSRMAEAAGLRSGTGDTTDDTLNLAETAEPAPETSDFAARALGFRDEDGGIHLHYDGTVVSVPRHTAGPDTGFGQQQALSSDAVAAHLLAAATRHVEKSRPEDFDALLARARRLMDGRHRPLALRNDLPEDELRRQETLRNIQLIVAHQLYLDRGSDEEARSRNALLVSEWFRKQFRTEHTEGFHVPAGGLLSDIFKREKRGLSSHGTEAGTSQAGTLTYSQDLSGTRFTWLDVTDWRRVGEQLGSNPGGTYLDQHGRQFYVKLSQTGDHARNEVLAAELYRISGVDVPALQLVTHRGRPGIASPIVEGARSDLQQRLKNDSDYRKAVQSGFAVDAWLANWDVAGAAFDNIVSSQHNAPVRIDTGGALLFRATGDPKGNSFGPQADEWESLRDKRINPQSSWVFSGMSSRRMKDSAGRVVSVRPEQVDATVDALGFNPATSGRLKEVLRARRLDIATRAGIIISETEGMSRAPEQIPPAETGFYGNPSFQSSAEDRARFSRTFRLYDRYVPRVHELTASHRSLQGIPQEDLVALLGYTGNAYFDVVNKALREQDSELLERYDAHIRGVVSGLNRLPVHKGPVTRAIEIYTPSELKRVVARYKVGTTIEEKSFVSTDAVKVTRPGNVIFNIESLTGRRVDMLSEYQVTETEVLFPPGTRFHVTKNSRKGADYHISLVEVASVHTAPHPSHAPGTSTSTSFHQSAAQAPAREHAFTPWNGPAVTTPSASQALAMLNRTAAAPQQPVQNLAEHMARMGLQTPSTSAPQAAGSHVRAYPP